MQKIKKRFMEILYIELDDLKEDLERLVDETENQRKKGILTEHVYMANLALYKNELLGVKSFNHILDHTDPSGFANLDDLLSHLRHSFQEKVRVGGRARAVNVCVERKLRQVARYVTQKSDLNPNTT